MISVMGDSHVLYLFYYLVFLLDPESAKQARKTHHNKAIKTYRYLWTTVISDFRSKIGTLVRQLRNNKHLFRDKTKNNNQLVILHSSSWDLGKYGPIGLISELSGMVHSLRGLQTRLLRQHINATLIWQTQPAYPSWGHFNNQYRRNSHVIGAINRLICDRLSLLDIGCIDAWSLTLAWQEQPVCKDHMLCAKGGVFTGEGGIMAAHKLIRSLCSQ